MEYLPREIYDEICTHFDRTSHGRPTLATLSKQWQTAIERLTFEELCIKSTELDTFSLIVRKHRRRFLIRLKFIVVLPSYDEDSRCKFEDANDRSKNNQAFTNAFSQLFSILQEWSLQDTGSLELILHDVYSISDHAFIRISDPSLDSEKALLLVRKNGDQQVIDLWSFRFCYSYVRFTEGCILPSISIISSFIVATPITRHVADRTVAEIIGSLSNLENARLLFNDGCIQYIDLRRNLRADFAGAIQQEIPRCRYLRSLRILMHGHQLWIPDSARGNLTGALDTTIDPPDALSTAIRAATSGMLHLENITIRGVIDSSLFMPPCQTLALPLWSNLQHLRVLFHNRRPQGGHYLRHANFPLFATPLQGPEPPGYHSAADDNNSTLSSAQFDPVSYHGNYRDFGHLDGDLLPDHDALETLFTAFVKTCQGLSMLKSASLYTVLPIPTAEQGASQNEQGVWGMWYLGPGEDDMHVIEEVGEEAFHRLAHHHRVFCKFNNWVPGTTLEQLVAHMGGDRCERVMVLPIA